MQKYKLGQSLCFANWVKKKNGSLSMFCIAERALFSRSMVFEMAMLIFITVCINHSLTFYLLLMIQEAFVDSVDQDQTAHHVQSDL